jgi:hypothetical protein
LPVIFPVADRIDDIPLAEKFTPEIIGITGEEGIVEIEDGKRHIHKRLEIIKRALYRKFVIWLK